MERTDFWAWSLRIGRISGMEIRLHWTLLIMIGLMARGLDPSWSWLFVLMFAASVVMVLLAVGLHELGHAITARLVGGSCDRIVLWMLGGLAACDVPRRPLPELLVSSAGIVVNLLLYGLCLLVLHTMPPIHSGIAATLISGFARLNLSLALLNLIPCHPLDGGRIFFILSSLVMGPMRAAMVTISLGYLCLGSLLVWSAMTGQSFLLFLAISLLATLIMDHMALRSGAPSPFDADLILGRDDGATWFGRWKLRRRRRSLARQEQKESEEQEAVDRLLAKVTASGLPSLTQRERNYLESFSRKQRARHAASGSLR